jgi:hypothetical protein
MLAGCDFIQITPDSLMYFISFQTTTVRYVLVKDVLGLESLQANLI